MIIIGVINNIINHHFHALKACACDRIYRYVKENKRIIGLVGSFNYTATWNYRFLFASVLKKTPPPV